MARAAPDGDVALRIDGRAGDGIIQRRGVATRLHAQPPGQVAQGIRRSLRKGAAENRQPYSRQPEHKTHFGLHRFLRKRIRNLIDYIEVEKFGLFACILQQSAGAVKDSGNIQARRILAAGLRPLINPVAAEISLKDL